MAYFVPSCFAFVHRFVRERAHRGVPNAQNDHNTLFVAFVRFDYVKQNTKNVSAVPIPHLSYERTRVNKTAVLGKRKTPRHFA